MKQLETEPARVPAWAIVFLAATLSGYVVCTGRSLALASWDHLAFVGTVLALAGWGLGTLGLDLLRHRSEDRLRQVLAGLAGLVAVLVPATLTAAMRLPVSARLPAGDLGPWAARWIALVVLLGLPLAAGGAAFGAAVRLAGPALSGLLAAGWAGAALGVTATLALLNIATPLWLAYGLSLGALLASAGLWQASPGKRAFLLVGVAALCGALGYSYPPAIRPDPDKYAAGTQADRWLATALGPRAIIDFHERSGTQAPDPHPGSESEPAILDWSWDGHYGGRFGADRAETGDAVRLVELAFQVAPVETRVLLLGELNGGSIWQAHHRQAASIDVVHPLGTLLDALAGPLSSASGGALKLPEVHAHATTPRYYVERFRERFDLVHITLADPRSIDGQVQAGVGPDFLLTVEGLGSAFRALRNDGVLAACCPAQPGAPAVRLLVTLAAALERRGRDDPGRQVAVLRDARLVYLLAKERPFVATEVSALRKAAELSGLAVCWLPRSDAEVGTGTGGTLPGGPLAAAAAQIFSPDRQEFLAQATDALDPPTDNRPFFTDFARLRAPRTVTAVAAPGSTLSAASTFLLMGAAAGVLLVVAGAALALAALLAGRARRTGQRLVSLAYFSAVATASVFATLGFWPKITMLVGDAQVAIAVAVGVFLAAAALGSVSAGRTLCAEQSRLGLLVLGIAATSCVGYLICGLGAPQAAGWPIGSRVGMAALLFAPVAYLLGFAAPAGLARIARGAPQLLAWSLAAGSLALVLAIPLGMVGAMGAGFLAVGSAALFLAGLAAVLFPYLPEDF